MVSNGCGPILLCRVYSCGYKSAGKAHCEKPCSPASRIIVFFSFAHVFTATLHLVMDLEKHTREESSEVDGPPSLLPSFLREQG